MVAADKDRMMKITGRVTSCCLALFLALTSVSAVQILKSISALKTIDFGQSVPKHSLLLLHWFANTVDIDNNNIWLTFDPDEDYGSHHYGNFEGVLDPLPQGFRYYTVGNLNQETSVPLPFHVLRPHMLEFVGRNRDRIIIRVTEQNTGGRARQRIDQVYITQHYDTSEHLGTQYDPHHTYQITTNLLRQIRAFSVGENQQTLSELRNRFASNADDFYIRNTWGHLACLGLFLFIVIQEKNSSNQRNNRQQSNNRPQNNNRSQRDNRLQHSRPQNYNRPQIYNRPEHDNRPQIYNRPQSNNRPQCNKCCCYLIITILVLVIIFLGIYFGTKVKT